MYTTILTSLDNGIFTITINRPEKLNALNKHVLNDLNNVIDEIQNDPVIKTVIKKDIKTVINMNVNNEHEHQHTSNQYK